MCAFSPTGTYYTAWQAMSVHLRVEWRKGCASAFHPVGLCVSHGTSTLVLLKEFSRTHLTFGSNAVTVDLAVSLDVFISCWGHSIGLLDHLLSTECENSCFYHIFWKPIILLEFSRIHGLIHLFNKHSWSTQFVPGGVSNSEDAKVCPRGEYGAEGLPRFPPKRL